MIGDERETGAIASLSVLLWKGAGASISIGAALLCVFEPVLAGDVAKPVPTLQAASTQVETILFANPRWPAVRVVRGTAQSVPPAPTATTAAPAPVFRATATNTQLVTFGDGRGERVQVVRGSGLPAVAGGRVLAAPRAPGGAEIVQFGGFGAPAVSVIRGREPSDDGIGLFDPAKGGELDRVAFAVDGAESGHGSNLAMWRPEPGGPQGPMQVSAAAAFDVGGGDRFDLRQNRLIGRAYLALLYQRYGNWPDAIAAYNWGPGNLDQWISTGRQVDRLPLETARYLLKVLRDAFLIAPSRQ